MIVVTQRLLSPSCIKKIKEGLKSFIHLFNLMLKSLKNITHCISYSLGHGIRPSILIKAPIGQKYLQRKEAREQGQDTKQAKMFSKRVCGLLVPLANSTAF